MLQKIRDRATGPLAWFVVGIICIPFAFFGIEAFRSDAGAGPVAKVGNTEISEGELQQRYQQRYQQLQQMLGQNFRADLINPDSLRESVLDGMIQEAVNTEYLSDQHYRISDDRVLAYVRGQEGFQENGNFSASLYRDSLARQGMNPIQFEDRVRAFMASQQLRQAVSNTTVVTDAELAQSWAWEKQQRRFAYRVYKADVVKAGIKIDDAAIQARYDERKANLLAPERVTLSYVELDLQHIKDQVEVTPAALQKLYDAEKDSRFKVSEERKAQHILVRASDPEAKSKIEAAAKRIAAGEDFAKVAEDVSQDPGSKSKGGDLGWVTTGMMVQPFEDALFALPVNTLSEPVETDFGWHIIEVSEIRPARMRGFDEPETQLELEDLYRDQQARAKFDEASEQLEQLSFENPGSLDVLKDKLGLEIKTSEWISRNGGAGIGGSEDVVKAAFSDLVLKDKENSLPIKVGRRDIVLRINQHEEERQQTLDEVRDDLQQQLTREAVNEKLKALAEADKALLQDGKTLADLEAADWAQNQPALTVQRSDSKPSRGVVAALFNMAAPADSTPAFEITSMGSGDDLALLELTEITSGDWAKASEGDKTATRQRVSATRANQEYAALEASLRKQAKVKILRKSF